MSANSLPAVKAVRERTFATPGGRYAVRLYRPTIALPYGQSLVSWEVERLNPDRTRVVVARGEDAMRHEITLSIVDAALAVCVLARSNRVREWDGPAGFEPAYALQLWAYSRQDAREHAKAATPGYFGEDTTRRGVRCARVAWASYFGWTFPDGYVDGTHLRISNNDNPNN
jgi:hypothetical protein